MSAVHDEFVATLKAFEGMTTERLQRTVVATAFLLAEQVVIGGPFGNPTGTPVDTGNARAHWTPSLNTPVPSALSTPDPSGATPLNRMVDVLSDFQLGDAIWLTNGVDYIRALEYGHSRQAPLGMVAPMMASAQLLLDHVVERVRNGQEDANGSTG
jgi:hypothetical protein